MVSISLCMIVKNEEDVLSRCLDSVKDIADEIIIIDTGSTDNTKSIAKEYTNNVYDFNWVDDFSIARNFSFSKATKEYILWLDADDVILDSDREKFIELKNSLDENVDMVMMRYNVAFDDNNNPTFSYNRERLVKNNRGYKWISPIHEVIEPYGNVITSDIAISHKKLKVNDPKRNIKIFNKMIENGINLDSRQKFYYARELYYNEQYNESIDMFNKFLDDKNAWIENKIDACLDLSKCYYSINDSKMALFSMLRSLEYDIPRANICCQIGNYFINNSMINQAIFWYKTATKLKPNINGGGFEQLEYYDYIPYINLCVCYYRLGDIELANEYNEKAGSIRPNDTAYIYNKKFFE